MPLLLIVTVFVSTQSRCEVTKNGHWTSCRPGTAGRSYSSVYHSDRLSVARGRFDGLGVSRQWGYLCEVWGVWRVHNCHTGIRRCSTISNAARPHSSRCRRERGCRMSKYTLAARPLLRVAATASTPVTPRGPSIDHELRAHFLIATIYPS